jgi:hypothetical protein
MSEDPERVIETLYDVDESNLILRRSNGTVIGEGNLSGGKRLLMFLKYDYNITATAPPSSSQIRTDTSDAASTTLLWIHRIDNENRDLKYLLMQLKVGDSIFVQDTQNADSYVIFKLLEDPKDDGNYVTYKVDAIEFSGVSLVGSAILVGLFG